jgi:hypothetical protein
VGIISSYVPTLKPFCVAFFQDWRLPVDGALAQRVAHVQPAVAHVEALVEALCAAAHDHHLLAAQDIDAVGEFAERSMNRQLAQLVELQAQWQRVEIIV